ncbi:MAG: hypothetical protein AAFR52_15870 [Pseudomonadota bacterium]
MIVIEIVAFMLMLACLVQAGRYAARRSRELLLPILIYLTVATLLGFAALGGESQLIADPATSAARAALIVAIAAVVGGYFWLVRKARARAALRGDAQDDR